MYSAWRHSKNKNKLNSRLKTHISHFNDADCLKKKKKERFFLCCCFVPTSATYSKNSPLSYCLAFTVHVNRLILHGKPSCFIVYIFQVSSLCVTGVWRFRIQTLPDKQVCVRGVQPQWNQKKLQQLARAPQLLQKWNCALGQCCFSVQPMLCS